MEKRFDDLTLQELQYNLPLTCDNVNTDDIASSPYFQTYVDAFYRRFPDKVVIDTPEFIVEDPAQKVIDAPVKKDIKCARRLFPLVMVFIFSLLTLAVAIIGIFKIEAIASYTALSGDFVSVVSLIDCFSLGGATIEGVFAYVLPVALYFSLAVMLIVLVASIIGFCKCSKVCGFAWLTLVAFLLALLAAVSLYLVSGAPEISNFIDFGKAKSIGYAFLAILGLELLAFIFALFVHKKSK